LSSDELDHGASERSQALVCTEVAKIGAYDTNTQRPARSHADLDRAYEFLNRELFGGLLPPCFITPQRTRKSYGYFSPDRLSNIDDPRETVSEIGLNPIHFAAQLTTNVLATLTHEIVHHWQHNFGTPSRGGYHNKEWARKMVEIGLIPSSTGSPGGNPTGETVSHYIKPGGRFDVVCSAYLASNSVALFQDRAYRELSDGESPSNDDPTGDNEPAVRRDSSRLEKAERERERKAASKTRFTCTRCGQNAWASRNAKILCGGDDCDGERMA